MTTQTFPKVAGPHQTSANSPEMQYKLPQVAAQNGWTVELTKAADLFGDVRIAAYSPDGDTVRMTFDDCGKLAGAYLYPRRGNLRHSEHVNAVADWFTGAWRDA